eukprot:252970-Amphidinium_carterae.1
MSVTILNIIFISRRVKLKEGQKYHCWFLFGRVNGESLEGPGSHSWGIPTPDSDRESVMMIQCQWQCKSLSAHSLSLGQKCKSLSAHSLSLGQKCRSLCAHSLWSATGKVRACLHQRSFKCDLSLSAAQCLVELVTQIAVTKCSITLIIQHLRRPGVAQASTVCVCVSVSHYSVISEMSITKNVIRSTMEIPAATLAWQCPDRLEVGTRSWSQSIRGVLCCEWTTQRPRSLTRPSRLRKQPTRVRFSRVRLGSAHLEQRFVRASVKMRGWSQATMGLTWTMPMSPRLSIRAAMLFMAAEPYQAIGVF